MKILLIIAILIPLSSVSSAQLFSGEPLRGAALGGLLGGIIGHNSGRKTAEGIGIGAGTGWLLGALSREGRERGSYDTYIPSRRHSVYADSPPAYRTTHRPNYAVTGTVIGGLAGGIIGHNQGRRTMEGAGIGAATGLVLGGIAEHVSRRRESRHYYAEEAPPRPTVKYFRNPIVPATSSDVPRTTVQTKLRRPTVFQRVKSSQTSRSTGTQNGPMVVNNFYITHQHPVAATPASDSAKK
jgi:uncharacterized protein YcfJ